MDPGTIPLIDYAHREQAGWLESLDRACQGWGCFQLQNHGIHGDLCRALLDQMARFFALPQEEKQALERTEANPWGFYDRELTKNVPDWKQILDIGPTSANSPFGDARTRWPARLPGFRATAEAYFAACEALALALLSYIGQCLGTAAGALEAEFGDGHSSFLRLNYYPTCAAPERHLGISHHTDAGALTLLLPDTQPGLQFLHEGEWQTVIAEPGALIINIGDIIQVWSNDRYRAPVHRVLANAERRRYSAPFFLNPRYDTVYAPLASATQGTAPRYRPINWGEFRAGRAAGDYANLGEEVQISDYRISGEEA